MFLTAPSQHFKVSCSERLGLPILFASGRATKPTGLPAALQKFAKETKQEEGNLSLENAIKITPVILCEHNVNAAYIPSISIRHAQNWERV